MENHFIFHGVGQGLFYFGSIDNGNFNFIYDCGTFDFINQEKVRVKQEIIDKQYKNTQLDFIVISHLHEDHINLLPYIIKNLKKDGKIYLPYFPKAQNYTLAFIAYLIINDIDLNSEEYQLLYEFYIERREGSNLRNYRDNLEFVDENNEEVSFTYPEETENEKRFPMWWFKFYNRHLDENKIKTINDAIKQKIESAGVSTIEEYLSKDFENRKKELQNVFGTIKKTDFVDKTNLNIIKNATSLLLLHHPVYGPATLLSGDAEFDSDLEKRINKGLKKQCHKLDIFQIPHHGSFFNWNSISGNWKFLPKKLIVSFGWPNKHGHPSSYFYTSMKSKILKLNQINFVYYDDDDSLPDIEKEHSFEYYIYNYWHPYYFEPFFDRWVLKTFD